MRFTYVIVNLSTPNVCQVNPNETAAQTAVRYYGKLATVEADAHDESVIHIVKDHRKVAYIKRISLPHSTGL